MYISKMDTISEEHRSWNMSRIKSKDTKPEVLVRKWLFAQGFRFRKNDSRLPGKPDIVLPKYHTVVFVHGCFWHHHANCRRATTPKSNEKYWEAKFNYNIRNDNKHKAHLEELGWKVIVLWECELKTGTFEEKMDWLQKEIKEK